MSKSSASNASASPSRDYGLTICRRLTTIIRRPTQVDTPIGAVACTSLAIAATKEISISMIYDARPAHAGLMGACRCIRSATGWGIRTWRRRACRLKSHRPDQFKIAKAVRLSGPFLLYGL